MGKNTNSKMPLQLYGNSATLLAKAIVGCEEEEEEEWEEDEGEFDEEDEDEVVQKETGEAEVKDKDGLPVFSGKVVEVWGERGDMVRIGKNRFKDDPWECPICLSSDSEFRVRVVDCGHMYCEECLYSHCESQLADRGRLRQKLLIVRHLSIHDHEDYDDCDCNPTPMVDLSLIPYGICCPDPNCSLVIQERDLESCWRSHQVTARFKSLTALDFKESVANVRFCPVCGEAAHPEPQSLVRRPPPSRTRNRGQAKRLRRMAYHQRTNGRVAFRERFEYEKRARAEEEILAQESLPYRCTSPKCNQLFCARCNHDIHPGKTCRTAARISAMLTNPKFVEGALSRWIARASNASLLKACPHCREVIEKNQGCDHMFCVKCRKSFNWSGARPVPVNLRRPPPTLESLAKAFGPLAAGFLK